MSGRAALREAIHHNAKRHAVREQAVRRARVSVLQPLTITLFGFSHPLTEANDFDLSAWMQLYQSVVGLEVGDLVLVSHEDTLLLFDVATSKDVIGKFAAKGLH